MQELFQEPGPFRLVEPGTKFKRSAIVSSVEIVPALEVVLCDSLGTIGRTLQY